MRTQEENDELLAALIYAALVGFTAFGAGVAALIYFLIK